jgi:hypothetical protein
VSRIRLDLHIGILLGFTLIAVAPLTAPGYFSLAHDARHTVYFFQMFDAALRDGALYPRWAADMTFGYGYPVWIILAPLPYYLGELFHLVGLDFVSAAKAVDATALIASGLTMYIFAARVMGKNAGLVASIAYLFIPYHIVDLYVRAAGAEFLAFVFPPLVLWALYELALTGRALYVPLAALAYAGLVLTHVQMALIFSPMIGCYVIMLWVLEWRASNSRRGLALLAHPFAQGEKVSGSSTVRLLLFPIAAILLGLMISATFLVPVVFEQRYLTTDPLIGGFFNFREHFISIAQLLSPFWGYGYAGINGADQFSLQLGIVPLMLAVLTPFVLHRREDSSITAHLILFALLSIIVILLMLSVSSPVWEIAAPVIAFIQFPWRLLSVTALTVAFLAGAAVRVFPSDDSFVAALLLSLLLVLAIFPDARPQYTEAVFNYNTMMDFEVQNRELLGDTIWMAPGRRPLDSPLVEQYRAGKITQKAVAVDGSANVDLIAHSSQWDEVRVNATQPTRVLFYTRYFPGWTATIDGAFASVEPYGEQGLISVNVPSGVHTVRAQFGDTWPRQAGAVISLVSLLCVMGWLWKTSRIMIL